DGLGKPPLARRAQRQQHRRQGILQPLLGMGHVRVRRGAAGDADDVLSLVESKRRPADARDAAGVLLKRDTRAIWKLLRGAPLASAREHECMGRPPIWPAAICSGSARPFISRSTSMAQASARHILVSTEEKC